mmetsp:Transcript_40984/g.121537  ORF Transcript_40984/g.121537 Transcript_40984/m.121537 type:complete len:484 (+) Transcript_40984:816-2267(+)
MPVGILRRRRRADHDDNLRVLGRLQGELEVGEVGRHDDLHARSPRAVADPLHRRDDVRGGHVSGATAGVRAAGSPRVHRVLQGCRGPQDRQLPDQLRAQREQVVVLQEDYALRGGLLRQLQVGGGPLVAAPLPVARQRAPRVLVEAHVVDRGQDPAGRLLHGVGVHRGERRALEVLGGRLLHVQTFLDRLGAVRGVPIGHDEAGEAHSLLQVAVQKIVVLAGVRAVDPVIGAHHSAGPGSERCLERRVVELPRDPVTHHGVHGTSHRLLLVEGEVLHDRHDALALHRTNVGVRELRTEVGVLPGEVLEVPPAVRGAVHIHAGPEDHVGPLPLELGPDRGGNPRNHAHVPSRRLGQHGRPGRHGAVLVAARGSEAGAGILHLQRWHSQAIDGAGDPDPGAVRQEAAPRDEPEALLVGHLTLGLGGLRARILPRARHQCVRLVQGHHILLRDGIGLRDALLPSQLDDPGARPVCHEQHDAERCGC